MGIEDVGSEIVKDLGEVGLDARIPLLLHLLPGALEAVMRRPVLEPEIVMAGHAINRDAVSDLLGTRLTGDAGGAHIVTHRHQLLGQVLDGSLRAADNMRRIKGAQMENSHTFTS